MDNPVPQRKFDYRGSVITIELTGSGDQICVGADVHTDGKLVGRVALSAGEGGLEALIEKLSRRAQELVDSLQAGSGSIAALASEEHREPNLQRAGDVVERDG